SRGHGGRGGGKFAVHFGKERGTSAEGAAPAAGDGFREKLTVSLRYQTTAPVPSTAIRMTRAMSRPKQDFMGAGATRSLTICRSAARTRFQTLFGTTKRAA